MLRHAARYEDMRAPANQNTTPVDLDVLLPGSASNKSVENFIEEAHHRSLKVTDLKHPQNKALRVQYRELLSEMPTSTMKKVPPGQLDTWQGRAQAITQLQTKHSGEVVELDPRTQGWRLLDINNVPVSDRAASSEQVWCMPNGRTRSNCEYEQFLLWYPTAYDCGYNASAEALYSQHQQCSHEVQHTGLSFDSFMPDWDEQWNRLQVPCARAPGYMWFRIGRVITLGELFLALGQVYTAKAIYAFYRTLRIVVLKRRKDHSNKSGSASARTGLIRSPLQANRIKYSLCSDNTIKNYLVAEYCKAVGHRDKRVTKQKVDAAVRHMHKILLCDLNPLGGPPIPPGSARGRHPVSFRAPELSAVGRRATGEDTCPIRT